MSHHAEFAKRPVATASGARRADGQDHVPSSHVQALGALAQRMNARPAVAQLQALSAQLEGRSGTATSGLQTAVSRNIVQMMSVTQLDVGKEFNIRLKGGGAAVGTLMEIRGGGWYKFNVAGEVVNIQGSDNIVSAVSALGGGYYSSTSFPTDQNTFDIEGLSAQQGLAPKHIMHQIKNSFDEEPRTMTIRHTTGEKTISKGFKAYSDPEETVMNHQAMVSYSTSGYSPHKKIGKHYSHWADELSGSDEDEDVKQKRAESMIDYLEGRGGPKSKDLTGKQKAAFGGIITAGMISDPLRTDVKSTRTETDFMEQLQERANGEISFHEMFGSKKDSTFLPARKEGAKQQREMLLEEDSD